MRFLGAFLVICLALAAMKVMAMVIVLVIIAAIVINGVQRPAQTLCFLAGFVLLALFSSHPWAGLAIVLTLLALGRLGRSS